METLTIAGVVAASGGEFDQNRSDFDILLQAVQATDLVEALDDPGADLTVFAPDDGAFVRLAQDLGFGGNSETGAFQAIVAALTDLGGGDPIPLLRNILLYHVSPGRRTANRLRAQGTVETLFEDATFEVQGDRLVDNEPDIADPRLTTTDLRTANGNIQVINRVLIPLDIPGNDVNPINGTQGRDRLNGTQANDVITGRGGRDRLLGRGGDDVLLGGAGADVLRGGSGDDRLSGGSGADTLSGDTGNDRLVGGRGRDLLVGGAGGRDSLIGGGGRDTLRGGSGRNELLGGNGRDRIITSDQRSSRSTVNGGNGDDQIILGDGIDTVILQQGNGTDRIRNFDLGRDSFRLGGGVTFQDLRFRQSNGLVQIRFEDDVLATVAGVSRAQLASADNFS